MSNKVEKPWGSYENLMDEEYGKVKRIIIKPGESPSYQYHHKRSEVWAILTGLAKIKIDGKVTCHNPGEIVIIPKEHKHQIENIGDDDLIFVEVQVGEYFGEDDIVRVEDKYGRV